MTFNDSLLLIFDLPKAQPLRLFCLVDQPRVGSTLACASSASDQSRPVVRKINPHICRKRCKRRRKKPDKSSSIFRFSLTMSCHTCKALIAHQCLSTISKHTLGWIYRVTLDAHLYCSWRGTSAEGMFHFQRRAPLNIVWQPNPEDHRTKKGIYLLVLSFKCSDDWKIPGWLSQYVNTVH